MSNSAQSLTVYQMIEKVLHRLNRSQVYFGHGTDNSMDESIALVFQTLRLPFDDFYNQLNITVNLDEQNKVFNILKKRISERKPLAYLVNEAYFAGLPFYVDERVLIPRSPIAELIEKSFTPWVNPEKVNAILDLCTGSGCIAIALALVFPNAKVDAVDISKDALEVAKINVEKYNVQNRVNLIHSNLFEKLKGKKYDIIVSNPPYVSQKELNAFPKEYTYEPQIGFLAEKDGLGVVIEIINSSKDYLNDNGILVVEVGDNKEELERIFPRIPFLWLEFERGEGEVLLLGKDMLFTNK